MSREDKHRMPRMLRQTAEPLAVGAIAMAISALYMFVSEVDSVSVVPAAMAGMISGGMVRAFRDRVRVRTRIACPPTFWLDRIAQFFWSKKTYERVFAPVKADLVHEWMVAEVAGQPRKAWFIKWIRGPFTQLSHMVTQVPWSIAKRVVEMMRAASK